MNVKKITSSTNAVFDGVYRIVRLRLVAGSDAASAILYDSLTQAGTDFCKLVTDTAADSDKESFGWTEGLKTSLGVSVTLSGTGAVLYIYYA